MPPASSGVAHPSVLCLGGDFGRLRPASLSHQAHQRFWEGHDFSRAANSQIQSRPRREPTTLALSFFRG